jgi:hypothetical protein
MRPKLSEKELAVSVIEAMRQWHWEIYQEVIYGGGRCDIVGKCGNLLWAVECKTTFSLAVIEQAYNARFHAHYSSVAVPTQNNFAEHICRQLGIGAIHCKGYADPVERVKPKLNRRPMLFKLVDDQKTSGEAGSQNSDYYTPFRKTVKNLIGYVSRHEGCHFDEALKEIDYHYHTFGSAKSCLRGFIGTVIPELRAEIINKKLCLFLNNKAA